MLLSDPRCLPPCAGLTGAGVDRTASPGVVGHVRDGGPRLAAAGPLSEAVRAPSATARERSWGRPACRRRGGPGRTLAPTGGSGRAGVTPPGGVAHWGRRRGEGRYGGRRPPAGGGP